VGVVEEVEAEVEQRTGDGLAVQQEVLLVQMPAARADEQHGRLVIKPVGLAFRAVEGDDTVDRVAQIALALKGRRPGGGVGVLEVGHVDAGSGVERVDDHLAINGAGDLYPAVLQVVGDGGDGPIGGADVGRLRQKVGHDAGADLRLALGPPRQQFQPPPVKGALQRGHKRQRLRR